MKIGSALPRLLERRYPTVKPSYPLLTVLYLLRIQDIVAVPIVEDGAKRRAVFGFSILPKLIALNRKNLDEYLAGPCEEASEQLDSFTMDDDLEKLLEAFRASKLGVSLVTGRVKGTPRTSFVSLFDLLRLYKTKQFVSDMDAQEVGSPIVALSGRTSVREAVQTMFKLRQRRIFISGERTYISDRSIVARVLSPASLVMDPTEPEVGALDVAIDGLIKTSPLDVDQGSSMQSAAHRLRSEWGPCLTVRGKELVVTPWDVIMKPWEAGRLKVSPRAQI